MWRSWPLAVPFILRALIASASLLWMLMNAAYAQGTLITYVRTPDDSVISQMLIKETTIHDYRMNLFDNGTNPFNFVAVEFTVNNSGKYFFGQQEAPMDTVMLLYKGSFDPNAVKTNLVAANDDWYRFDGNKMGTNYNTQTPADTCAKEAYSCISLDANTTLALKRCGTATRLCPGMHAQLEPNTKYFMIVTHYDINDRVQFQLPQTFWCFGGSCALKTTQVAPPAPPEPTPTPPAPTPTTPTTDTPTNTPTTDTPTTNTPTTDTPTTNTPNTNTPPTDTPTTNTPTDNTPPTKANVDAVTTFLSLITQERGLAQVMSLQASRLVGAVENDCPQFDAQGFCMSLRMRGGAGGGFEEGAGIFILSKRVGDHLRTGFFADYVVAAHEPTGFKVKDQRPTFGGFVGYSQTGGKEGYHARVAVAYHSGLLTSMREIILTSEAGRGTSALFGYALRSEVAHTSRIKDILVTPFAALRHLQVLRDAYTETAVAGSVEAPLSLNQSRLTLTSLIAGVRIEGRIAGSIGYQASLSGEYDALRRVTSMSGTSNIEKLETFGIQRSFNKDPLRLSATAGLFWELGKSNRIVVQTGLRGSPSQVGAVTTLLGYQIAF